MPAEKLQRSRLRAAALIAALAAIPAIFSWSEPARGDLPRCVSPDGTIRTFPPGGKANGGEVQCVIPQGVTRVKFVAWGAQGGSTTRGNGLAGGYATRTLNVVPGQNVFKAVGGQQGGNGEGFGSIDGGGGGGASGVYIKDPPTSIDHVIVIAGGGGGGGCADGGYGGGVPRSGLPSGYGGDGSACSDGHAGGGGGAQQGGRTDTCGSCAGGYGLGGDGGTGTPSYGGFGGGAGYTGTGGPGADRNLSGGGGGGYGGGAGGRGAGGGGGGSYPPSKTDRYNYGNGVVTMQAAGPGLKTPRCQFAATERGQRHLGTPADETICARGGGDNVAADEGNDVIIGGPGVDRMRGGKGFDVCNGGPGNDIAYPSCEKVISAEPAGG